MNRKWFVSIAATVFAALLPMAAAAQIAPDRPERAEDPYASLKWKGYLGVGYTELNQVNTSRYGLIGVNVGASRDFGRYWALVADGGFYRYAYESGNPGNPSVDVILAGPELHGQIFERWSLYGRALIGGEHTGGNAQTPSVSFAGGLGGGIEYQWTHRLSFRLGGDNIASSFSLINNSSQLANSPHRTWSPRAGITVGYRF